MLIPSHAERCDDLATLAAMMVDRVHENLAVAIDLDGKPAVIVSPKAAQEMHLLAREISRRAFELAREAE